MKPRSRIRSRWRSAGSAPPALAAAAGLLLAGGAGGPGVAAGGAEAGPVDGATETRLTVRVVAHDAKVIGSNVGGARVTVRDVATGEVLAEGVQEGSTGSTERIMLRPHRRGETLYGTEGAAAFVATLPLERPTRVEVVGEGPLGTPHAAQRASKTTVLLPGRHVEGEGLILELNGFTVRIDSVAPAAGGAGLRVRAHVEMLCGCPIEPGGLWEADRMTVEARLLAGGDPVSVSPLSYAGQTSAFAGELSAPGPGRYEIEVVASDPERANFGLARAELTIGG